MLTCCVINGDDIVNETVYTRRLDHQRCNQEMLYQRRSNSYPIRSLIRLSLKLRKFPCTYSLHAVFGDIC